MKARSRYLLASWVCIVALTMGKYYKHYLLINLAFSRICRQFSNPSLHYLFSCLVVPLQTFVLIPHWRYVQVCTLYTVFTTALLFEGLYLMQAAASTACNKLSTFSLLNKIKACGFFGDSYEVRPKLLY